MNKILVLSALLFGVGVYFVFASGSFTMTGYAIWENDVARDSSLISGLTLVLASLYLLHKFKSKF